MVPRQARGAATVSAVRFIVNAVVFMLSAAVALIIADVSLSGLTIQYPIGFLIVVVVFGLIQAIAEPILAKVTRKNAEALTGVVGLASVVVALGVTGLFGDNLSIDGISTLVIASVIVWIASIIAGFVLKITMARRLIKDVRD